MPLLSCTDSQQTHSQRYVMLDYARVIAAFLVIFGHLYTPDSTNYVRVFIYQFHMALFFVISGMLHKYNDTIQLRKYIRTLIIPVCFFSITFFCLSSALYQYDWWGYKEAVPNSVVKDNLSFTMISYMKYSIIDIFYGYSMLNGPLWFLISLFYCKILMDAFCKYRLICVLVLFVLFVVLCIYRHKYLFMPNGIMAMPFYYLGFKYKRLLIKISSSKFNILIFCLSWFVVFCIAKYNGTVSMWAIKFGEHSKVISIPLFYMVGIVRTIMVLSVSSLFKSPPQIITITAKSFISILGFQVPIIFIVDNTIGYNLDYFSSLLIASFIMFVCVFLHHIIDSHCPILIGKK